MLFMEVYVLHKYAKYSIYIYIQGTLLMASGPVMGKHGHMTSRSISPGPTPRLPDAKLPTQDALD